MRVPMAAIAVCSTKMAAKVLRSDESAHQEDVYGIYGVRYKLLLELEDELVRKQTPKWR